MKKGITRRDFVNGAALALAADPTKSFVVPEVELTVPYLNFAPILNALPDLQEAAKNADAALGGTMTASSKLNEHLYRSERSMTDNEGLPRRPWFRHMVYAPGFYTGYGVKTLPGIREAIEKRNWEEAEYEIHRVTSMLKRVTKTLQNVVTETNR